MPHRHSDCSDCKGIHATGIFYIDSCGCSVSISGLNLTALIANTTSAYAQPLTPVITSNRRLVLKLTIGTVDLLATTKKAGQEAHFLKVHNASKQKGRGMFIPLPYLKHTIYGLSTPRTALFHLHHYDAL